MSETPDELIEQVPGYCQACGEGLDRFPGLLSERRQVVDVPPIEPVYREHRIYSKTCLCGHVTKGAFPSNVKALYNMDLG